ncbi:MAG: hypothetical protein ACK5KT_15735 [Dysgonomonas sp.]
MGRKSIEEIFSDGSRWKMSLMKRNFLNPNKGHDEETKKKISDSLKKYHSGINNNNLDDKK